MSRKVEISCLMLIWVVWQKISLCFFYLLCCLAVLQVQILFLSGQRFCLSLSLFSFVSSGGRIVYVWIIRNKSRGKEYFVHSSGNFEIYCCCSLFLSVQTCIIYMYLCALPYIPKRISIKLSALLFKTKHIIVITIIIFFKIMQLGRVFFFFLVCWSPSLLQLYFNLDP